MLPLSMLSSQPLVLEKCIFLLVKIPKHLQVKVYAKHRRKNNATW